MKKVIGRGVLAVSACAVLALPPHAEASPILVINGAGKLVGGNDTLDSLTDPRAPEGLINQIGLGRFDHVGLVFRFGGSSDTLTGAELLGVTGRGLLEESVTASTANPSTLSSDISAAVPLTPVPEPASLLLLGTGIAGLAAKARRRR